MKRKRNKEKKEKKEKKKKIKKEEHECPFTIEEDEEEVKILNLGNIIDEDEYFLMKKGKRMHAYPVGYEIERKIKEEKYRFKILKGKEGPIFQVIKNKEEEKEYENLKELNDKYKKDVYCFQNFIIQELFKQLKERKTVKFTEDTIYNEDSWITCPLCNRTFSKYQIIFHLEMKHPKEKKKLIKLINKNI